LGCWDKREVVLTLDTTGEATESDTTVAVLVVTVEKLTVAGEPLTPIELFNIN